jgi:AcrR family transcriptional regulator
MGSGTKPIARRARGRVTGEGGAAPAGWRRRQSRADRQATTTDHLLDAAAEMIAGSGYDGVSVDAIAAAAGLTKGAVYARYASKEDLLLALFDRRAAEGQAGLEAILASPAPAAVRLASIDRWQRAEPERARVWALLELELGLAAARKPALRRRLAERRRAIHRVVARMIAAQGGGGWGAFTPDALAVAITALSDGLTLQRLIAPDSVPDELFSRAIGRLIGLGASAMRPRRPAPRAPRD